MKLQDTVASASSLAQSLKSDLADGQRKLLALAENAGTSSSRVGALNTKQNSGGLGGLPEKVCRFSFSYCNFMPIDLLDLVLKTVFMNFTALQAISLEHLEESLDPTKELSRLVSECKFE